MKKEWKLSPQLQSLISDKLSQYGPDGVGSEFYPSIIWSLGGIAHNRDNDSKSINPHYTLGWIKSSDLDRFTILQHDRFKYVAFEPNQEDLISPNSTLDFLDDNIVVR